jgi:lipid II:glycine glycyltransferase (peptidoglycan interpeptide bridge formation enzyme)
LWGIARKESKEHPWYGLTQFKKGFGGQLIKLPPTTDYPFSFKYWFNYIYEKIKRGKL